MQKAKIVLLFSLIKALLFAQTTFNQKYHYTSLDGLSNNKITGIAKDKDGFIWTSTFGGINRFDGNTFKKYYAFYGDSSALKDNWLKAILYYKNNLYLLSSSRLYQYNSKEDDFLAFDIPQVSILEDYSNIDTLNDELIISGRKIIRFNTISNKFIDDANLSRLSFV
jgi:ligand-binding sensor domain-containing protein